MDSSSSETCMIEGAIGVGRLRSPSSAQYTMSASPCLPRSLPLPTDHAPLSPVSPVQERKPDEWWKRMAKLSRPSLCRPFLHAVLDATVAVSTPSSPPSPNHA
ncbi:hypothetical protein ARMSODRAFT_1025672 [Armillaria solidipes]|uniref:Uncharacterized protein n=1 Tax=Armillaria solidipes TaxID=1076256 RepID=A0A2H3BES7_9AGAR|nr:hypothetical protein ARMSODRAFT_1025672 [Armillaria solidipes]